MSDSIFWENLFKNLGKEIQLSDNLEGVPACIKNLLNLTPEKKLCIQNPKVEHDKQKSQWTVSGELNLTQKAPSREDVSAKLTGIKLIICTKEKSVSTVKASVSGELVLGTQKNSFQISISTVESDNLIGIVVLTEKPALLSDFLCLFSKDIMANIPDGFNIGVKQIAVAKMADGQYIINAWSEFSIALGKLPLVPTAFSNFSVKFNKLQAGYSSGTLSKKDAELLNKSFFSENKLTTTKYDSGVYLSGVLRLGTKDYPVYLGSIEEPEDDKKKQSTPKADKKPENQSPKTEDKSKPAPVSANAPKWFPIDKQLAGLYLSRLGIDFKNGLAVVLLDASITIGPITGSLEGLGVSSPLTSFKPSFQLTGIGITYRNPPIMIDGMVRKSTAQNGSDLRLDGMLTVQAADWALTAIASYVEQSNGKSSFFAYLEFNKTLGGPPAFVIEGIMGGFGINYDLNLPDFDNLEKFPFLQYPSKSSNPTRQQADKMLTTLLNTPTGNAGKATCWLTPAEKGFWIAAGLRFSSFGLMTGSLLAVVQVKDDFVISILGKSDLTLPKGANSSNAYVSVQLKLQAKIRPSDGEFSVQAQLTDSSFLLTKDCKLTGGFAFYLWFGKNSNAGQFVLTIGGYHPAFRVPDYYPKVPRVGFNWNISSSLVIKGQAYLAVTPSCCMAGGSLEVNYSSGIVRAWFCAQANILIAWDPFSFIADMMISVGAAVRINFFFCTKEISISLGARLDLWGSPLGGRVSLKVLFLTIPISFGASPKNSSRNTPLNWSGFKRLLPADICQINVSSGLQASEEKEEQLSGYDIKFQLQSKVPCTSIQLGNQSLKANGNQDHISIRPMGKRKVSSVQKITISHDDKPIDDTQIKDWQWEATYEDIPEALWGSVLTENGHFTQSPSVPSSNVVKKQLCGLTLKAPKPNTGNNFPGISSDSRNEVNHTMPLHKQEANSNRFQPTSKEDSMKRVAGISGKTADQKRKLLFANLCKLSGVELEGCDSSMSCMGEQAGELFADSVLIYTGEGKE